MAWFFKALHLEVLKALLPYESVAPVAEEQRTLETDGTPPQEHEGEPSVDEQEPVMPEEETIKQEQDASLVPTNVEQECQEQPAPEPKSEYLMTEDPDAGWATRTSAARWADRLHEWVREDGYRADVLPTRFGRWGFSLYKQCQPELVWQYIATSAVAAHIEEVKQQRFTL